MFQVKSQLLLLLFLKLVEAFEAFFIQLDGKHMTHMTMCSIWAGVLGEGAEMMDGQIQSE